MDDLEIKRNIKIGDMVNWTTLWSPIFVSSADDLPTPTDTEDGNWLWHRLEAKLYTLINDFTLEYPIIGGVVLFEWIATVTYTGTGALFRNNTTTPILILRSQGITFVWNWTNQAFNITAGLAVDFRDSVFRNLDMGVISNLNGVFFLSSGFRLQKWKLLLEDIANRISFLDFGLVTPAPISDSLIEIIGSSSVTVETAFIEPSGSDSAFNIDSWFTGSFDFSHSKALGNGIMFNSNWLNETSPRVNSIAVSGISDSTVKGALRITNNTEKTTIDSANTPVPINTIWTDGIQERMRFQDACIFTASTDIITTTFTHWLSAWDVISFIEDGWLPTGLSAWVDYYVLEDTATTFQVEATLGGGAVDFTTDWTPDNYYRHRTGNTGSGWLVYIWIEEVTININGFISARMDTWVAKEIWAVVIKTETDFSENIDSRGSSVSPL